jgi:hypothetical protein
MNKENPIHLSCKIKSILRKFDGVFQHLGKYLFFPAIFFLVLGFSLFEYLHFKSSNSEIQYLPSDVIYGEKVLAIHSMAPGKLSSSDERLNNDPSLKPEILISEKYYDFGVIQTDQAVIHTFVIKNCGQSPLMIQNAYTTCDCTTAEFSAKEIPPGKVVLMTLQFRPGLHNMMGATVRRGVIFKTNDPVHPTQEIWIQATVH